MYKTIYPIADTVLYERYPTQNVGTDQILELGKIAGGQSVKENDENLYLDSNYNSRILIKFDLSEISASISSGKITGTNQFFLNLRATEAIELPIQYTIEAYPVSQSWVNGTGFFNSNPIITNGTSWRYRDSKLIGTSWQTSSFNSLSTGSWSTNPGGGAWFTSSYATQSFNHDSPDIRMDVTSIVRAWISGSIPNEGFILKFPTSVEQDLSILGNIQFFSKETHTVSIPRLECFWQDFNLSGTGSFTEIGSDDFVLYTKNLRESYSDNEKPKLRIGVRERYPTLTYVTSSNYLTTKRLPTSSYYQIQDYITDDILIPFHNYGTKVNCDSLGNYIQMDMNSFLPERYYRLVFKSEFDGGDTIRVVDDGYIFRIQRN